MKIVGLCHPRSHGAFVKEILDQCGCNVGNERFDKDGILGWPLCMIESQEKEVDNFVFLPPEVRCIPPADNLIHIVRDPFYLIPDLIYNETSIHSRLKLFTKTEVGANLLEQEIDSICKFDEYIRAKNPTITYKVEDDSNELSKHFDCKTKLNNPPNCEFTMGDVLLEFGEPRLKYKVMINEYCERYGYPHLFEIKKIKNPPTIIVLIAAYRDTELPKTLQSLIHEAMYPERLRFGINLQLSEEDKKVCGKYHFPYHPHYRIVEFDSSESKGACWARNETGKLYKGETFFCQIDSHMRAEKYWDQELVESWERAEDPNAILSTFVAGYKHDTEYRYTDQLPHMKNGKFNSSIYGAQAEALVLPKHRPCKPQLNPYVAGGLIFGPGRVIKDVPYDPRGYFFGEEITMAVRYWTHGYNMYTPDVNIFYHLYERHNVGDSYHTHWSDRVSIDEHQNPAVCRIHKLLGSKKMSDIPQYKKEYVADLPKYGLGKVRSLKQYEKFSGINFKNNSVIEKNCWE